MRIVLALFIFTLIGCAKDKSAPEVSCAEDTQPHEVRYPDNVTRKSKVTFCSDDCYKVESVEDDDEAFSYCD